MYCGACGAKLNPGAKFCRVCGSQQAADVPAAPPPPPPPPALWGQGQAAVQMVTVVALLAIAGGATFCFLTLFATVYQPLHYDNSVNYGEAIQFGDVLAGVSGVAAVALGLMILFRPRNLAAYGLGLLIAGAPTLLFAVIWAVSDLSDLFSRPFYFGLVYFADFGRIETGSHVIQLLLLVAGAMVVGAGALALPLGQRVPSRR